MVNDEFLREQFLGTLGFQLFCCGVTRFNYQYTEAMSSDPHSGITQTQNARSMSQALGRAPVFREDGDAMIIPADMVTVHYRLLLPPGEEAAIRWSRFKFQVMGSLDAFSFFELPHIVSGETAERLGDINESLTKISQAEGIPPLAAAAEIKRLGFEMLALVCQVAPLKPLREGFWGDMRRIKPALDYIDSSFAKRTTIQELAKLAGMSPPRFHAVFKAVTGSAPVEHLIKRRMKHAQSLLDLKDRSVREIAEECGYEDQYFFSRTFKNYAGMSPMEYRKKRQSSFSASVAVHVGNP